MSQPAGLERSKSKQEIALGTFLNIEEPLIAPLLTQLREL